MENELERFRVYLQNLRGKSLKKIIYNLGMLILQFDGGDGCIFHISCWFRFVERDKILLTEQDYYASVSYESLTKRQLKKRSFHINSLYFSSARCILRNNPAKLVKNVILNSFFDLDIIFDSGLVIQIRPDLRFERSELYRLFPHKTKGTHFVVHSEQGQPQLYVSDYSEAEMGRKIDWPPKLRKMLKKAEEDSDSIP